MIRSNYRAMAFLLAFLLVGPQAAEASSVSYSGNFAQDNNVQLFNFSVVTPSTVTMETTSFLTGGFAPILTLFDQFGNYDGEVDAANSDAVYSLLLSAPGIYTLALTEYFNKAAGPDLAAGFDNAGLPGEANFTGILYGVPGQSFIAPDGAQRSSAWAVTIQTVNTAVSVPEPDSLSLAIAGMAALAAFLRRRPAV